jgi:flagellar biosynthesis protein FlhG
MNGSVRSTESGFIDDGHDELTPLEPQKPSGLASFSNPFDFIAVPAPQRFKQIWAIGGGKGGVGKSLVTSSLAIALSRMGHRVVAVDLDLGGANLHTTLGIDLPKYSLSDFLTGRTNTIESCITPSGIANLNLISGAQDSLGITQLALQDKVRLLQQLSELNTDYILLDLGAGTGENTLDFFIYADLGITVLLPEPTSIENVYRFLKGAYYRRLMISKRLTDIRSLIDAATDSKNNQGIKSPSDLFRIVNDANPEAAMKLKQEIEKFRPKLIVNQIRTQTDIDIGFSVKTVCKKYFGIEMDYVGYLDYDSSVWQAVRKKRPLMLEFPNSKLVSSMDRAAQYLTKRYGLYRNDFY